MQQFFTKFENRDDDWNFGDFEFELGEKILKSHDTHECRYLIIDADKLGLFPKTVKRYVLTMRQGYVGKPASELGALCNKIISNLTIEEKKEWGID